MLGADARIRFRLLVEVTHRVAAQQREVISGRKRVPQYLELHGGFRLSGFPEHIDHFAVCTHGSAWVDPAELTQHGPHIRGEQLRIRGPVDHADAERLVGIEKYQVTRTLRVLDVDETAPQLRDDLLFVRRSGDDDRRIPRGKTLGEKSGDHPAEARRVLVEMNAVTVRL